MALAARDARGIKAWLAFGIALVATGGSLFFSEIEHFVPCKLCWFQRIAMYPLVLLALPALARDNRAGRYFLPLPVVGLAVSLWHILVERGVIEETQSCEISAPGGCSVKWIEELGYITIPTLAATAFALCIVHAVPRRRAQGVVAVRTTTSEVCRRFAHVSPAARPSGVARKCSNGTCRNVPSASASSASTSRSSAAISIRRPRSLVTRALTASGALIGAGLR